MDTPLSWDRDGADWPLRAHSRFITVGHLRWHLQQLPPGGEATASAAEGSTNETAGAAADAAAGAAARPASALTPTSGPMRLWLLHGTGAGTHTWRDLAPLLAQHHEVLAVDLPGHAFTRGAVDADLTLPGMADALLKLRAALGPSRRHEAWIGHSAGAAVALQILHSLQKDSVDPLPAVVSLNGALLPWGGPASGLFMPMARALATWSWSLRFFAWSARRPGTVEALLRDTGSVIDARGVALYERLAHNEAHVKAVMRMMAQWELEPFARALPELQGRVTLISSAFDGTVPPSVSARAARLIGGARLVPLPRWGHLGHEEDPAEWTSLILQALQP